MDDLPAVSKPHRRVHILKAWRLEQPNGCITERWHPEEIVQLEGARQISLSR